MKSIDSYSSFFVFKRNITEEKNVLENTLLCTAS